MTTIPVTILDDFLDNPNEVREWALSLEYQKSKKGNYPGKRSKFLDEIHPPFYDYINKKILNLFFPSSPASWVSETEFHISTNLEKTGWIHQDPNHITAIIYLSPEEPGVNRGTSLYKLKQNKLHPYNSPEESTLIQHMPNHYLTGKISEEVFNLKNDWEKNTFDKILDIPDKFNRLIAFDPYTYHANNNITSKESPDRLTLITFINEISHPANFPIPRSKQIMTI
jgi:hypothetical protein